MGIRNGVLQNAKPLTDEQMRLLRNRVNETGEYAICISPLPNKKLTIICPRTPPTSDLFALAWERYEILRGASSYDISSYIYDRSGNACGVANLNLGGVGEK